MKMAAGQQASRPATDRPQASNRPASSNRPTGRSLQQESRRLRRHGVAFLPGRFIGG